MFMIRLFVRLLRMDRRLYGKLAERFCFAANMDSGVEDYVTLHVRPKETFRREPRILQDDGNDAAILVQGQIVRDGRFTINTLARYRKMFPNAPIVMSTWASEKAEDLEEIEALGVQMVLCDPPPMSGFLNFNLQRETTIQGLKAVSSLGVSQVLKTRSDQRIYDNHALAFLQALLIRFPAGKGEKSRGRVFVLNTTSLSNVPFHVCDMLQFGYVGDVVNFWNAPAHVENMGRGRFEAELEGRQKLSELIARTPTNPEVWLGRSYAALLYGSDALGSPKETYLRLIREAIGIIDQSQLDLLWPKYNAYEVPADYQTPWIMERLTFEKWLALCAGTAQDVVSYDPETYL